MKKHWKAEQVKMCDVVPDRPGIIKPFLMPTKLRNQVRVGGKKAELKFKPAGKTLVGGVQWTIVPQRPGIAESLIVPKQEMKALERGMQVEAALATEHAKMKAVAQADKAAVEVAKAQAASVEAEKSVAEMAGWSGWAGIARRPRMRRTRRARRR